MDPVPDNAAEIIAEAESEPLHPDWIYCSFTNNAKVPDYWRGYVARMNGEIGDLLRADSKEFRDEILRVLKNSWSLNDNPPQPENEPHDTLTPQAQDPPEPQPQAVEAG